MNLSPEVENNAFEVTNPPSKVNYHAFDITNP